ncbi:MAG: hypothetical protein AAF408_20220, partial [Pseudomonadota bacterium]
MITLGNISELASPNQMAQTGQKKPRQVEMFKSPKDHPNPTWGIVCTARETPDVICAFAAHHVAAGASKIYLYLDEPSARASALLKMIPEVDVTVCDADHWQRLTGGRRP